MRIISQLSVRLALTLALLMLAACASPPKQIENACKIYEDKPSWYRATARAERRWGVPDYIILSIIRQESAFDHNARPPRGRFLFIFPGSRPSSAYGYPQAVDGTWDAYRRSTGRGGADRDDFSDAADFVGWYADLASRQAGISKYNAYALYLAYHEGPSNYVRGTYRSKNWLMRAAAQVNSRAHSYSAQLNGCRNQFRRGIPFIPFI